TNIYGNGNNVNTDVGANGWAPTVSTGLGDGPVSCTPPTPSPGDTEVPPPRKPFTFPAPPTKSGSRFSKWWEPAAARASESATDSAIEGIDAAGKAASKAITRKLDRPAAPSSTANPQPSLIALNPSATQSGNASILTGSTAPSLLAYPTATPVPLPNPDEPSQPGPSGDRTWLLDTVTWSQEFTRGWNIAGSNGMQWTGLESLIFPVSTDTNWTSTSSPTAYPLPFSFVRAYPDSSWAAMYNTHSMWNCGWRVQVTVNGSQFHAGALILYMVPEATTHAIQTARDNAGFVFPYVILNLYESNTATIEVPYISPTPNTSSGLHAPWTFYLQVLSPLNPPPSLPTSLSCSIYVTPVDSSFHGLRYLAPQ
uniref:capsid protein VP0 n=1 Tax=Aichi virus (strain Human/A846/88/1989) TaxID=650132 RepID=UPI000A178801|nr:Chain B, capsid protein VP0 [Aichi virus A846/88]